MRDKLEMNRPRRLGSHNLPREEHTTDHPDDQPRPGPTCSIHLSHLLPTMATYDGYFHKSDQAFESFQRSAYQGYTLLISLPAL